MLGPVLVVYYFFPTHCDQPWLTRTSALWLAVPTVAMSTLVFFTRSKERAPGQLPHFLLMLACMGFLVWLATKAPRTGPLTDAASFRLKPIAWGGAPVPVVAFAPPAPPPP